MENIEVIKDVLNDIKHTTNQLKGMIDNLEHHLQQATKVEKKLKAYHVKDEYSYYCLMKEFEEQGYTWTSNMEPTHVFHWDIYENDTVIYCHENKKFTYSNLDGFNASRKDNYDLIEYKKEEPKFYAKIKGWELIKNDDGDCYWHKDKNPIHGVYPWDRHEASIYTKTEWNKLGINDTNADFEEVAE